LLARKEDSVTTDDEQIKKDIVDQLYWDQSVDASGITVKVSGGNVTLNGTVPSFNARRAAHNDVIMVPGVVSVNNELKIELPPALPEVADEEIKERAENIFSWMEDIDAEDITVSVHAGKVSLNGYVDTYWKKIRAEDTIKDLRGVVEVENALSVIPTENLSDKIIAHDVISALKRRENLDVNLVDLTVDDGIVTLSGTLPDWSTIIDVERIARLTAGVKNVINDLGVLTA
jgi:osmotically-inducible protein OsmY